MGDAALHPIWVSGCTQGQAIASHDAGEVVDHVTLPCGRKGHSGVCCCWKGLLLTPSPRTTTTSSPAFLHSHKDDTHVREQFECPVPCCHTWGAVTAPSWCWAAGVHHGTGDNLLMGARGLLFGVLA